MPPKSVLPPELDLDLREEARRFVRERTPVTLTGIVLGVAFLGVGGYLIGPLVRAGAVPGEVLSVLLLVLGVGLIVLSLRTGLINPVTSVLADRRGLTYTWRWGSPFLRRWSDPGLLLVLDDLGPDPRSTEEQKRHVYFGGPRSVYGLLPVASIGPLLDVARGHGLSIRMGVEVERRGRNERRIRRIRIAQASEA